jgi:serine/threonine protein phosphatase PrpC
MIGNQRSTLWRAVGRSVRGASHRRGNIPNQDAIAWAPETASGSPLILSVADGHGAQASFRSATGSALAVDVAIGLLTELIGGHAGAELDELRQAALRTLPRELPARWRRAVGEHAVANPLPASAGNPAKGDAAIAYGSTLLAAAVTEEFVVLLQLGDGDILLVAESGEVRRPWLADRRFLGGETASLCTPDAWTHVRIDVQPLHPETHQLILLCTDGYANSFREDDGFLRTGRDILEIIQHDGIGRVEEELEQWLWEASEYGSGDDVTSGILWRAAAAGSEAGA